MQRQLRSQIIYERETKLGEPDLVRRALKRPRALPSERDLKLMREKLSIGGFGDGEGIWVASRS